MTNTLSPASLPNSTQRTATDHFAIGSPGGPGNPFARKTAALRAYLINHVTERDIQDILDILLLNAKGGHLPTIKFLFSYVLGKPKPVVEPDLLDLQEMLMLQQAAQAPEALEELCGQLPLDFNVKLTRHAQTENAAAAVRTADPQQSADATPPPPSPPGAPSSNGVNGEPRASGAKEAPSTNGEIPGRSPPCRPPGFDWLAEFRRVFGGLAPP
jgi:hypothetical protein